MYGTVKVGNQSTKMFCELRNNQTSPGLRGMEGLIRSSTNVMCGVTSIREGVPFDSTLKFSVKSILFNLVISLEIDINKNTIPSKHLLVLKTSSTRLQRNDFTSSKTSWRRLEGILQDVLKTSWRHVLRRLEDVSWRSLEDISWGRREDTTETNKILTGDICI